MTALQIGGPALTIFSTIMAGLVTIAAAVIAVRGNRRIKKIEVDAAAQAAAAERAAAEQKAALERVAQARGQDLNDRQSSYDQLQEDIAALRKELAQVKQRHSEEISEVRTDLARSKTRERAVEGYAWDLRRYIERGEGPPPPPWPKVLEEEAA
jgi:ribosomal protein L29